MIILYIVTDQGSSRSQCFDARSVKGLSLMFMDQGAKATTTATSTRTSKKKSVYIGKTTTLHVHHAFLYISLPSLHDYHVKMPSFTFCEGRKQAMSDKKFGRNSAPEEFDCIEQSKRVGIITIDTDKM